MPLIPIKFPPGFYKNGTPYAQKGRWADGSLVRYHDGAVRPIGGWQRRKDSNQTDISTLIADDTLEAVRDIFSWRDNNQNRNAVFGSNLGIYHMDDDGVITDITYGTYAANNTSKDASTIAGYGQGDYGEGDFGAGNNLEGLEANPPDRWYFDNFGEILLTGSRNNGGIYELDLGTLTLSGVTNSPSPVQALIVTDQRQVLTIGGNGEPRRVQASDVEDRTTWTPAVDNQCIDRTLRGSGKLLNIVPVNGQYLILGENDAHAATYIGPPYVMSISLVGEKCGPLATEAVTSIDRFAVWWGERNFWLYDGTVQPLPCEVLDYLYTDIEPLQVSKIQAFTNTDFSEIWWLYQSLSSTTTEVDSYVAWNYRQNRWYTGRLDRTAGVDKNVWSTPLMVKSSGEIYNHELDDVLPTNEGDVYIESGPIEIKNGDKNIAIRYLFPDTAGTTGVSVTFKGKEMPDATEYSYGPYTYANPMSIRAMGRELRMRVDFSDPRSEWGIPRVDIAPIGTGMR